jgi:hypothetical protein
MSTVSLSSPHRPNLNCQTPVLKSQWFVGHASSLSHLRVRIGIPLEAASSLREAGCGPLCGNDRVFASACCSSSGNSRSASASHSTVPLFRNRLRAVNLGPKQRSVRKKRRGQLGHNHRRLFTTYQRLVLLRQQISLISMFHANNMIDTIIH